MAFFTFRRVAEGYASHRPYYHPLVMDRIRQRVDLKGRCNDALDVGCGTGLSSMALQALANNVTGIDGSAEMIEVANAGAHHGIDYLHAPAEELPFETESFDLVTACGAINWIDRTRFFPEARRVLKDRGWVVLYDNFITDQMKEGDDYTHWYQEQFLSRYPKPPRDEAPLTSAECEEYGFSFSEEEINNELAMSRTEYVEFMLTQSNVIAAVDMGDEALAVAREWMDATLEPIVPGEEKATFLFGGYIWYMQKV